MATKVIGIDCSFLGGIVEIPYHDSVSAKPGDHVIYKDSDDKEEFGVVRYLNRVAMEEEKILTSSKILRPATPHDLQKVESYGEARLQALETCQDLVDKYALEMQVFNANYSFDGTKVYFMFTAEDRVDFRELVKDLAKSLKKQIYLRQVGPRDKAKIIGGFGKCGKALCCSKFLRKLESISMDMVRVQGLESKGSSKLSGACGKLLCCLKYEVETYKDLRKSLPEVGSVIRLKKSFAPVFQEGNVIGLDVLNQKIKVIVNGDYMVATPKDVDKILKTPPERRPYRASAGESDEAVEAVLPEEESLNQ